MSSNLTKVIAGSIIAGGLITGGYLLSQDKTGHPETSRGDKDCTDFTTQREAQRFFESQGGPAKDPHGLDRDRDSIACESL